jgi:RNA polymerase sigma factor (sigma-70 family)
MDIVQIIDGCKRNEGRYQKILYERFYGYGLKISFRYVHQYDVAVNVTNDGFVKVFRHIEKFDYREKYSPEGLLMAWIKQIIINLSIDELRKNERILEMGSFPENVWEIPDRDLGADTPLLFKDLIIYVKNLPLKYRTVFNMYVIDGFTHLEIAKSLGIAIGTSKSNLSRARDILQKNIIEREQKSYLI